MEPAVAHLDGAPGALASHAEAPNLLFPKRPPPSSEKWANLTDEEDAERAEEAAAQKANLARSVASRLDRPEVHVLAVILAMLLALELPARAQDPPPMSRLSVVFSSRSLRTELGMGLEFSLALR